MRNEQVTEKKNTEIGYREVKKFQELFDALNADKLGGEYQAAYDEAVELAKGLAETKDKSSWWDSEIFQSTTGEKYPTLPVAFIEALARCVKNYNAPVNLPAEPLWQ